MIWEVWGDNMFCLDTLVFSCHKCLKRAIFKPLVINLGALGNMTNSSSCFLTYSSCIGNQADGMFVTIAGQWNISLAKDIMHEIVLHVPRLSVNLLSICKIIKNLVCSMKFSPSEFFFRNFVCGWWLGMLERR